MTNSLASGVAWVVAHPTRKNVPNAHYRIGYGWSWSQLCVALVFWALGATETWDSANLARAHSTIVSTDRNPPDGAIGWFLLGKFGHVCFFNGGVMYSATKWASNIGTALGTLTIEEYERLSGAKWVGWGWDFGGQTFAGISTAGTGTVTPVTAPNIEGNIMTDAIYYADPASKLSTAIPTGTGKGIQVLPGSMWYQECPGAPLFALSGNKAYTSIAGGIEYLAFLAQKPNDDAGRHEAPAQSIADLIAARGVTSKPVGNFNGGSSDFTFTFPKGFAGTFSA